ncbi:hypothetical protein RF11_10153 [Thelohanellus kitauei]|uniref:Uncharacterized protein n=1 Tax=Thelohanellus kitauei TaxID=669202 RepID=A0A0C2MWR6_THEKT|nr:hypothetical protein RF11_10153 [Thelohanellus kitauei]
MESRIKALIIINLKNYYFNTSTEFILPDVHIKLQHVRIMWRRNSIFVHYSPRLNERGLFFRKGRPYTKPAFVICHANFCSHLLPQHKGKYRKQVSIDGSENKHILLPERYRKNFLKPDASFLKPFF